jgi:hypothetical protein
MGNPFEMKKIVVFICLLALVFHTPGRAQNYHAVEGSPFAGSLGVANNPASILSAPYPWDITVFSFQLKNSTNVVDIHNFSLITSPDSSKYQFTQGNRSRYFNFNFNVHLLNARISLSRHAAIAFGANLRGYGIGKSSTFGYNDTLHNLTEFFNINNGNLPFSANVVSSTWIELFATYSKTVRDDETGRLNLGFTLKAMRGISGGFAQLTGGSVQSVPFRNQIAYTLKAGTAKYGYSSNYDTWQSSRSTGENLNQFLVNSRGGLAIDLGAEYYIKTQAVKVYGDDDDYYDYEWKIGAALLDIGQNQYKYGTQSALAFNPRPNVADSNLDAKFGSDLKTIAQFNDSLRTIVNTFQALRGVYNIRNPARLVINVDRPLPNHFYINGDLSINLTGGNSGKTLSVQEMNLLTVTPRWETKRWGYYLPIQYTTTGRLMIGGAFKAGPLLFGIHNWGNVFSRNKMQNGGGYIAFVIRPGNGSREKEKKMYTCPKVGN